MDLYRFLDWYRCPIPDRYRYPFWFRDLCLFLGLYRCPFPDLYRFLNRYQDPNLSRFPDLCRYLDLYQCPFLDRYPCLVPVATPAPKATTLVEPGG